jgi:hypothetical protein
MHPSIRTSILGGIQPRRQARSLVGGATITLLIALLLCGCASVTPLTSTTRLAPTTTIAIPTASFTPPAGQCNAADFPPPIRNPPTPAVGGDLGPFYGAPVADFAFPEGTYYRDLGPAAGTHFWDMCSPGAPAAIMAFMRASIAASAWKILPGSTSTALGAQLPVTPPTTPEYCRTLQVIVGGYTGYPGQWSFAEFAPVSTCQ